MQPNLSDEARASRNSKLKLIWGLILLIGPTLLLIVTVLLYALINFIVSGSVMGTENGVISPPSMAERIVKIVLFIIGAVVFLTWLPGIIAGIILLVTRNK